MYYYNFKPKLNTYVIKKNNYYYFLLYKKTLNFLIKIPNVYINLDFFYFLKKKNIKNLSLFFFSWNNFIVKKIKFKHKISWFYVYRRNLNLIKVNTNLSEKIFFIFNFFKIRRKKNYFSYHTLVIWGLNFYLLNYLLNKIIKLFYINEYTQKGFKLSRSKLLKRVGKINKYSTIKNKLL